jgi:formylglycine-generating enzyme required for sulfatase activity
MQWALDHRKILRIDSTVLNKEGDKQPLLDLSRSGFRLEDDRFSLHGVTGSQPCLEITWYGAQAFCNFLSEMEGLERCIDFSTWACDFSKNGYRLPTEAEWEFACRAGTTTDFPTGDLVYPIYDPVDPNLDVIGWYRGNIEGFIHNIGEKEPTGWGLYDMNGGVAEWCYDWYDREYYGESPLVDPRGPKNGEERVKRGGSSFDIARHCRSSYRGLCAPDGSYGNLGFRPSRSWVE